MSAPKRIQLRRTKGWRKPEGAIVVARPSKWGNPFKMDGCIEAGFADTHQHARAVCAEAFESSLKYGSASFWWHDRYADQFAWMLAHLDELRGHDLACWCPLDQPCHGDVLLDLANRAGG